MLGAFDVSAVSFGDLVRCEPRLEVQFMLVLCYAIAMKVVFVNWFGRRLFVSWLTQAADEETRKRFIKIVQGLFKKQLSLELDEREAVHQVSDVVVAAGVQHVIGGFMAAPSAFGLYSLGSKSTLAMIACHGCAMEAGYELYDLIFRFWQRLALPDGRNRAPNGLIIAQIAHHSMGLGLVVPMNIYFHDDPVYHEAMFLLSGVAGLTLFSQVFGFTINVKTSSGLRTMQVMSVFVALAVYWSRGFRYVQIAYDLMPRVRASGVPWLRYHTPIALVSMGLLNCLFCTEVTLKMIKFLRMPRSTQMSEDSEHDHHDDCCASGSHLQLISKSSRNLLGALPSNEINKSKDK